MLPTMTARKQHLLQLPIVVSEPVWLQAIYINDFLFAELSDRMNAVLDAAYRALLQEQDGCDTLPFDLWAYPASGQRELPVCVHLQLQIETLNGQPHLLRILLSEDRTNAA